MAKKHYKAIRDNIPEIIRREGRECSVKALSDTEFLVEIEKKLSEELEEYLHSKNVEELADLLEVIYRIAELKGYTKEELEILRTGKNKKNGGFQKNLFLLETF
ncbi:MAG: hypothetical protein QG646_4283 [Euryarchaeota archaeon]|nr:hypothetical protein [Euryarchaeota archaeon]